MMEGEWQTAREPHGLLGYLQSSGIASDRKLRLFAVACSHRIWSHIDSQGRMAVEVAERFADGSATPEELRAARLACQGAGLQTSWYAAVSNAAIAARNAARSAQAGAASQDQESAELLAQSNLLRDIFGNPFRPITIEPGCRAPEVLGMAQTMYERDCFDGLSALSLALEKAGCTAQEVLEHCRAPGIHVRGCWVIDAILDKQ